MFSADHCQYLCLGASHEVQRDGIHAIPQTRGFWSIIEYMPQMRVAAAAGNRVALHTKAVVRTLDDVDGRYRLPETRPPGAGFELRLRIVQRGIAADATVQTVGMIARVLAREGYLGALLPGYAKCRGRQLRLPLRISLDDLRD